VHGADRREYLCPAKEQVSANWFDHIITSGTGGVDGHEVSKITSFEEFITTAKEAALGSVVIATNAACPDLIWTSPATTIM
jgi:hypothetical protein